MRATITKLSALRKIIKLPFVPLMWVGFVVWIVLVGSILLGAPAYLIYALLFLLFVDKLFMLAQFYGALATAKTFNYTLQALVETQLLMQEQTHTTKKISLGEEE